VLIFQQGKKGGFFEQVSKQIGQDKYTAETWQEGKTRMQNWPVR
jgi:hypothetical protein